MNRGEIWIVDLEPVLGSEQGKARPCVVMSSHAYDRAAVRVVVPLTSWQERFGRHSNKYRIYATSENNLRNDSAADALQIRTVSKARFKERIGQLEAEHVQQIVLLIRLVTGP